MSIMSNIASTCRLTVLGALILCLGGTANSLMAQGPSSHDSDKPVDYAADRIEVQDKAKRVLLTGNVDIKQQNLRMKAARTLVAYTNEGGDNGNIKIQRIDATGNVEINQGEDRVWGDMATYDFGRRVITVVGHVRLQNARGSGKGERLVIDLDHHTSNFVGASSGTASGNRGEASRVTGSFTVAKRAIRSPD